MVIIHSNRTPNLDHSIVKRGFFNVSKIVFKIQLEHDLWNVITAKYALIALIHLVCDIVVMLIFKIILIESSFV